MSTIRVEKTKNYSIISNHGLRNKALSWGARGLLCYLLSLPDDWIIQLEHLKNESADGETCTDNRIKELIKAGYLERSQEQKKKAGKFSSYDYTLYEVPPSAVFRGGLSGAGNRRLLNTKKLNTNSTEVPLHSSLVGTLEKSPIQQKSLDSNCLDILSKIIGDYDFEKCKLPKQGQAPTHRLVNINRILLLLYGGKFSAEYSDKLDKDWISKNNIDLPKLKEMVTSWEDLERLLKKACRRYFEDQEPGNWLWNKRVTRSFSTWLYNPETLKSWFLFYVFQKPQKKQEHRAEDIKERIPLSERKTAEKYITKHSTWPAVIFWMKVYEIYKWINSNRDKLKRNSQNFDVVCGQLWMMLKKWEEFENELTGGAGFLISNFGMEGKTWLLFTSWMKKTYGINLNIKE